MDAPGPRYRADWYPDPTGRFEFRYHNGTAWTADVSAGGVRYVDPVIASAPAGHAPAAQYRDGRATTAMILGIAAVCLTWMPVFFVVGVVLAIVAVALGVSSRRRSPHDARGFAAAGIATGAGALVLAGIGVWTTKMVFDAVEKYDDPPARVVSVTECTAADGLLTVGGTLENQSSEDSEYRVVFRIPGPGLDHVNVAVEVGEVGAGATATFTDRFDISRSLDPDDPDCRVMRVTGPLPFGVDLDDVDLGS